MSKYPQTQLNIGKHIVEVTTVTYGMDRREGRPTSYFLVKFENEKGYVFQKFYNNERGRILMGSFFSRFGVEPDSEQTQHLKEVMDWFVGKRVSLEVYLTENKEKETMGWKVAPGGYENPLEKILESMNKFNFGKDVF